MPEKDELKKIFNREFFEAINGSIFINNGRASHVDEVALLDALDKNKIRGAALDNYNPGGIISRENKRTNLVLSPHVAVWNPNYWTGQVKLFNSNLSSFKLKDISGMQGMIKLD